MRFQPNVRRIAAIHDLSGIGRTSLMAVIPILSTMGFNVCPLPTAILQSLAVPGLLLPGSHRRDAPHH